MLLRAMSLFQSLLLGLRVLDLLSFSSTDSVEVVRLDAGEFSESLASLGLALILLELTPCCLSVKATVCCALIHGILHVDPRVDEEEELGVVHDRLDRFAIVLFAEFVDGLAGCLSKPRCFK